MLRQWRCAGPWNRARPAWLQHLHTVHGTSVGVATGAVAPAHSFEASLRPPRRLRAKPVRTASGIAVVAVMSKPHRCPHIATTGNICVYCPGGPDSDFEYSTQSYTGYEPTSMRAIRARYNPYVQARSRVDQLRRLGHSLDKVCVGGGRKGKKAGGATHFPLAATGFRAMVGAVQVRQGVAPRPVCT